MQFIKNGPDIPERLLQAHEEGRVVFFCGAGISYPAHLPGFSDLVDRIFESTGESPNPVQKAAIKSKQFDTAIGLLEDGITGGRETVRRAVENILTPNLASTNSTATHEALLTLSKTRKDQYRLITTNFDRIFEEVIQKKGLNVARFNAPLLPIPKNRWDGLVYLHGLLAAKSTAGDLDRLVLSSGDFGLAYLSERWAARFVSELFRNYVVCFVGYSINDPVLRYMMDALAADRLLGESSPEMFAFGSFSSSTKAARENEWRAKNVTPILYREHRRHIYLHKTLHSWADIYRDGARGKQRIVAEYAMNRFLGSTQQDDFSGRMLWALSDPQGLPAKYFAELNPVPPLDWLVPLCDQRYGHTDLSLFGVRANAKKDENLKYSIVRRPTPYNRASLMSIVCSSNDVGGWDDVMFHLARWLVRHLNDPLLIWWIVKNGDQLNEHFAELLNQRFEEIAKLEQSSNIAELDLIKVNAPNAIPRAVLRPLWKLIIAGRVKLHRHDFNLFRWQEQFLREGITTILRFELRKILTPRISIRQPFSLNENKEHLDKTERLKDLIYWEIVLSTDHIQSVLSELTKTPNWKIALPFLVDDFQYLLCDALDLTATLGDANNHFDQAHWDRPSISDHWQNRNFNDWVFLIEFLRDAWLTTLETNPDQARHIFQSWRHIQYPTFRRMELFAATYEFVVHDNEWTDLLLTDDAWWLWSVETQRETMRVLVVRGAKLHLNLATKLIDAILNGPPRSWFRQDIEADRLEYTLNHMIWLRLAKLVDGGANLTANGQMRLDSLKNLYPNWKFTADQREEFSHWMSGTGDPDYYDQRVIDKVPRQRKELILWLKRPISTNPQYENDWSNVCRDKFATAVSGLISLAKDDSWPPEHWRDALQVWQEEKYLRQSWRRIALLVEKMPKETKRSIDYAITRWLQETAKVVVGHETVFFKLCNEIINLDRQEIDKQDQAIIYNLEYALNHPIGQITQAMLNWWFKRQPSDNQGLGIELKQIFTDLCNQDIEQFRQARSLLSANVIALFRVDREWTKLYVLPLFDWSNSQIEALCAWEGFLWSPRLYQPLFSEIKNDFLKTAEHYDELKDNGRQYAAILTYIALDPSDIFTISELQNVTKILPKEGLLVTAQTLINALQGAGEQGEIYWDNRVQPYWEKIWPKSRQYSSSSMSECVARLAISSGSAFPRALNVVSNWLTPIEHIYFVVHSLSDTDLCNRFPWEVLILLDRLINDQSKGPSELKNCLMVLKQESPEIIDDIRYQRLHEFVLKHS